MSHRLPLWAALTRPGSRAGKWLSYALIVLCCGLTLLERHLPMRELPQYAALSRMLLHLHDRHYEFAPYYTLDLWRGATLLPLWLWGFWADVVGMALACKLMACASVLLIQLGVCAVLRAQRKPVLLGLLALPFTYTSAFYYGLVPSNLSVGLALWAIAWLRRLPDAPHARWWLLALSVALPLTHPLGVLLLLLYVACLALAQGRLPATWPLSPLLLGAAYWGHAALHADGVAAFHSPGLALRLLRAPHVLLGGFQGRGEGWLLVASLVLWLYLCRPALSRVRRHRRLRLWAADAYFASACLLGYLVLPASTWTTTLVFPRMGGVLLVWLPVLVPRSGLRAVARRGPPLLVALAASSLWYSGVQLTRFSNEASALDAVIAAVPARPKLLCLTYDNQGQLARSSPYVHAGAYAQAERGGFVSLSRVDYAWTAPLRRRKHAIVPPPVYGSEWDPALLQRDPALLAFYDTVLVIGKEPREMTILMNTPYRLVARSGMFMVYTRRAR